MKIVYETMNLIFLHNDTNIIYKTATYKNVLVVVIYLLTYCSVCIGKPGQLVT